MKSNNSKLSFTDSGLCHLLERLPQTKIIKRVEGNKNNLFLYVSIFCCCVTTNIADLKNIDSLLSFPGSVVQAWLSRVLKSGSQRAAIQVSGLEFHLRLNVLFPAPMAECISLQLWKLWWLAFSRLAGEFLKLQVSDF